MAPDKINGEREVLRFFTNALDLDTLFAFARGRKGRVLGLNVKKLGLANLLKSNYDPMKIIENLFEIK